LLSSEPTTEPRRFGYTRAPERLTVASDLAVARFVVHHLVDKGLDEAAGIVARRKVTLAARDVVGRDHRPVRRSFLGDLA
jgi:hypothetical protein